VVLVGKRHLTNPPHHKENPMKKSTTVKKAAAIEVVVRRIGKAAGPAKPGQYVLIINPKVYGSDGKNWLGGRAFDTKELALAAAPKLGGRVAA